MYISSRKHILSGTILFCAGVNLAGALFMVLCRMLLTRSEFMLPDNMNEAVRHIHIALSICQLILIGAAFFLAFRRLSRYMGVISKEDRPEMGRLQEEALGEGLSSLTALEIHRLLEIWAVIFIVSRIIYDVSSLIYQKFVEVLSYMLYLTQGLGWDSYITIYNSTHGFKYMGMLLAILIGFMMTGIFLDDRLLMGITFLFSVLFLLAFGVFQMQTVEVLGKSIGIAWTSVIFHILETVGLIALALYLRVRYKGV